MSFYTYIKYIQRIILFLYIIKKKKHHLYNFFITIKSKRYDLLTFVRLN